MCIGVPWNFKTYIFHLRFFYHFCMDFEAKFPPTIDRSKLCGITEECPVISVTVLSVIRVLCFFLRLCLQ